MIYLIGLGLSERSISKEALMVLEKCHKVYVEGYTVNFPYKIEDLSLGLKRSKIKILKRKDVESNMLIKEAKSKRIALLIYGSPLFATTHASLIMDAKEQGVYVKIFHNASVFDAIGETGLQLYKFGKIASMPDWSDKGESLSFLDIVKDNIKIKAHSLILCDIDLDFKKSLRQLKEAAKQKKLKLDKILVCSRLGNEESFVIYDNLKNLEKREISTPFCFIIPNELHFLEKDSLERL